MSSNHLLLLLHAFTIIHIRILASQSKNRVLQILKTIGLLTLKIPRGFLTKLYNFWHSWRIIFSKNQSMRTWRSDHRISKLPCWTSISKTYSMSFHGIYKITTFKHQSFFGIIFTMDFFAPKSLKIRLYSFLYWVFYTSLLNQVEHVQLKFWLKICK
jgi:hypothetical protein